MTTLLQSAINLEAARKIKAVRRATRQSRLDRKASGTIWPNGEFSLAWPKERKDEATERDEEGERIFRAESRLVAIATLASLCGEIHTKSQTYPSCPWPRVKRGLKGITRYGKRFVRSAAVLLQRTYKKTRLSFLTLTLPELPDRQGAIIAEGWGVVVNRLVQWLKRRLTRLGLPTRLIGVSELQPQRLRDGSICVLHLHLVFVGRAKNRGQWGLRPVEVRKAWLRILSNELGEKVYSSACEELRMVKKSAEGYLGKYMSKGSEDVSHFVEMGQESMVPGQWWFCSSEMRQWVKSEICRGSHTGAALESLIQYLNEGHWENSGVWAYPCHINLDGLPYLVAWVGRLPGHLREDLTGMVKSCSSKIPIAR